MQKFFGIVIIMGCVVGGFLMSGGHLASFWQPGEIIIILGAGQVGGALQEFLGVADEGLEFGQEFILGGVHCGLARHVMLLVRVEVPSFRAPGAEESFS